MQKPKVTIGVCVRDGESTLHQAIESIISQDYPNELMEVIFVDDGSKDSTLSIINRKASKMSTQVKVFSQEWKGLGHSRNIVVENANGDYIVWVDGDMILQMDFIRKQVEFMQKNPKYGIAKARYGVSGEENLISFLDNISYTVADTLYGGKHTSKGLGTGGSIYRVEAIRQVGGFDADIFGVGEDLDAEVRVRQAGWLTLLGSPAVFYEQRKRCLKGFWRQGFWHGYGGHLLLRKNKGVFNIFMMTPLMGFIIGLWYATIAYKKISRRKIVFLLPFHYIIKRTAWCFGFIKGQTDEKKGIGLIST